MKGKLFLVPVLLDENNPPEKVLSRYTIEIAISLRSFIVENEKSARAFLKKIGVKTTQNELKILVYSKHQKDQTDSYFKDLEAGEDVGLLSEAGCPAVADPGSEIVHRAHQKGIQVVPLVGPSSILLAVMASGFNGQSFTFNGYLPIDKTARAKKIQELERISEKYDQTQLFIETPFRNNQLLDELLRTCKGNTLLSVACDLTAETEFIETRTIDDWKKNKPDLHKRPAIFSMYRKRH